MSGVEDFIEIHGEPSLLRTADIPLVRVPLPLEARPRADFVTFALRAAALVGGLTLLLFAWLLVVAAIAAAPLALVAFGPAGALLGLLGAGLLAGAAIYMRDLARAGPALELGASTFRDRRQMPAPIRWQEVARAAPIKSRFGVAAVRLTLRGPANNVRRNPLRFGASAYFFRQRREEIVVPLAFVHDGSIVARVMQALVARAGGAVE